MAVTYFEMSFEDFKSAYKSENNANIQDMMSKGIENADEAAAYAYIYNCAVAKNYAMNAVTFQVLAESTEIIFLNSN